MAMAQKRTDISTDALAADYTAGMNLRELAQRYGLTFQAIHGRLIRAGITMRWRGQAQPPKRPCAACGRVFQPQKESARYCSLACLPRRGTHYKTHCKRGHLLDGDNLSPRYGKSPPRCRECQRERQRVYDQKRRAKAKG